MIGWPQMSISQGKITCHVAISADEVATHHAIRREVFVSEQRLFEASDLDDLDADPGVRHVLGLVDDVPAGTVRLYRLGTNDSGQQEWKGDRLAVLPRFRHLGVGGPLVKYAVTTAGEAGGDLMRAFIQPSNVVFFRRLGWHVDGDPSDYLGSPHQKMWIELG